MRQGRYLWMAGLALIAIVALFVIAGLPHPQPEPVYDGHPLSYWTRQVWGLGLVSPSIDSNAVPGLIGALKKQESLWEELYYRGPGWMRAPLQRRLPAPFPTSEIREAAVHYLYSLGPAAKPAVPALIFALRHDPDPAVRLDCANALGEIGDASPPVIAALQAACSDPDKRLNGWIPNRASAALAKLGHLGN